MMRRLSTVPIAVLCDAGLLLSACGQRSESDANPNFKKVYDSYSTSRDNYAIWREYGYL